MPKVMKQPTSPFYAATHAQKDKPEFSPLCRRVLAYTPEQFVADVDAGVKPSVLFSEEENALLTPQEHGAIIHHVAELLEGFFKIKGWTEPEK